jgi:hypothetical protein
MALAREKPSAVPAIGQQAAKAEGPAHLSPQPTLSQQPAGSPQLGAQQSDEKATVSSA